MGKSINDVGSAVGGAVSGAVETVKSAVSNATDSISRSDAGKVIGTAAAPLTLTRDVTENVVRGDFNRAKNNLVGYGVNNNFFSNAINSSSSVRNALNSEAGNNLTLGFGRDAVRATDAGNYASAGGTLNSSQISDVTRYNVRSAAYGTAIAAGAAYGLGTTAYEYAAANPIAAITAGKLIADGRPGDAAGSIVDRYVPGAGSIVREIVGNTQPDRTPASEYPGFGTSPAYTGNTTYTSGLSGGMLAAAAAGIIGLMYLIARRK